MIEALARIDGNILLWIQEVVRNPILTPVFTFITTLGNAGTIWILFCIVLLSKKNTRRIGAMGIAALLGSVVINNYLLKNLVERPRPFDIIEGLHPLVTRPKDFSFPSGHTSSSFAAATVFYRNLPKRFGMWMLLLATLIGVSRLYVGVHYPSDVLVGIFVGVAIGFAAEGFVCWIQKKIKEKQKKIRRKEK